MSDASPTLRKQQGWPGGRWKVAEAHFGMGVSKGSGGTGWVSFLCWSLKHFFQHFSSEAKTYIIFFPITFYQ